ncbi:hypothetical protein Glove_137g141 [Diversispora epigaea]|uniref:Uncharacterized protein n=1 Tax=Diversispora epigaea TaxID=1348612 RepID=A0A397J089_9GLOM|nr:hypothetical protein Glove_137g141 [Diversispora epigaea]
MNPTTNSTITTSTMGVTEKPASGDPTNYCTIMHSSSRPISGVTEKPAGGDPTNYCSIISRDIFYANE